MTVFLFLLDGLTSFDIKNQILKSFVYFSPLVGTPTILLWNIFIIKTKTKRIIGTVCPTIVLIFFFVAGTMNIFFSSGAWQTQTVLYQNKYFSFKKVEFQLRDIGARGYNNRTVEVLYLTPLFMVTSEVPGDIDKRMEWTKVDKEINESALKVP